MTLTLPPEIGRRYLYRGKGRDDLEECEIVGIDEDEDEVSETGLLYISDNAWVFWPDGKAKIAPYGEEDYVAILVRDASASTLEALRAEHEERMKRLEELGL